MNGIPNRWYFVLVSIGILSVYLFGCSKKSTVTDIDTYVKDIQQWQKKRAVNLEKEDGWLSLCGLSWLIEGENRVGSDSSNTVVLPKGKAAAYIGSIFQNKGSFLFRAASGVEVKIKDSVVTEIALHHDQEQNIDPTILKVGTLSFYVIKRGDQFGVRVKDKDNPARLNFKGLDYFPINPDWRVEAVFQPYTPPKLLSVGSVIGVTEIDTCPGALVFDLNGQTCRLEPIIEQGSENELFIMFNDATNGNETYANGRQLYTSLPDANHHVIIDFNKAYNWPCVFSDFATCPIPPRQNTLPLRVTAGEKMYTGNTPGS